MVIRHLLKHFFRLKVVPPKPNSEVVSEMRHQLGDGGTLPEHDDTGALTCLFQEVKIPMFHFWARALAVRLQWKRRGRYFVLLGLSFWLLTAESHLGAQTIQMQPVRGVLF